MLREGLFEGFAFEFAVDVVIELLGGEVRCDEASLGVCCGGGAALGEGAYAQLCGLCFGDGGVVAEEAGEVLRLCLALLDEGEEGIDYWGLLKTRN